MASQPFDDSTKAFLSRFFQRRGLAVVTGMEVFARARTIDVAVACPEEECSQLAGTVFSHFRLLNSLELKGPRDPLTLEDYNRIVMRAWGMGALGVKRLEAIGMFTPAEARKAYARPRNRTVTIVCVTRPDAILDGGDVALHSTGEPGIYRCDDQVQQWLIHPTELKLHPRNYALLPLARGEKLRQFVEVCLQEGLPEHLTFIFDIGREIDPVAIWSRILEVIGMRPVAMPDEAWETIDEILRTQVAREKIALLRELVEEGEQRGERRGEQRGEQRGVLLGAVEEARRVLLRLLRRRFGELPGGVAQGVEGTADLDQLNQWIDAAFDAHALAEVGIPDGDA